MPKLKSLRGAVGSYGRVAAGGIVDVSEANAKKLLGTKRFVTANDADIAAVKKRQEAELAVESVGATPGFSAMPTPPDTTDRLSQMIKRGQIDRDKAKDLVALQINLSSDEIQAFIKDEADKIFAEVSAAQADLEAREQVLADREDQLAKREAEVTAREKAAPSIDPAPKAKAEDQAKAGADAAKPADAEKPEASDVKKAPK